MDKLNLILVGPDAALLPVTLPSPDPGSRHVVRAAYSAVSADSVGAGASTRAHGGSVPKPRP